MGSYFLSSSALHPTTNMKFLVLAACVAVSSGQGFYGLQSHPNGAVTPVEEPAVAAARADHLATKFGAGLGYAGYAPGYAGYAPGYAGYPPGYAAGYGYAAPVATGYAGYGAGYGYAGLGYAGYAPGYTAGYGYSGYAPAYAGAYGYAGPLNLNTQLIAHPNGAVVPLDEPAVAAARADHLASKGVAYAAAAPVVAAVPAVAAAPVAAVGYGYAGPLNLNTKLVGFTNGAVVPADEPAVAAACADHLASKEAAYAADPIVAAAPVADVGYSYNGPLNLNTEFLDYPNGAVVPVDEPAVAAARADHLASKEAAYAAAAPIVAAAPVAEVSYSYNGPLNLNTKLVGYSNGAVVPADEPAVAAARADHLDIQAGEYAASAPVLAAAPVATGGYSYAGPLNLNTELVDYPME